MSQTVALSAIQSRVCTLCGIEDTLSSSTSPTDTAMLDFLKVAAEMLAALVGERAHEMYFATTGTLTTTPATPTVSLSTLTNFSDLLKLSWQKSESEEIFLELAQVDDMRAWPANWGDAECVRPTYRMMGSSIALYPTPDAAYTLNVTYSTGLYPTTTASQFTARDNWQLWLTYQTCLLVRARQQKDATDFRIMLYGPDGQSGIDGSIRKQLRRDKVGVRRVRDVRSPVIRGQRDPWPAG